MSDREEKKRRPPSEDEARARDLVQRLPHSAPDPAFHDRLWREFASGDIASPVASSTAPSSGSRFAGRWQTRGLAAAAVVAVILIGAAASLLNRGPAWVVVGETGSGAVMLDSREIPAADLGRHLAPGSRLEVIGDLQLDLQLPGKVVLQITPGSDLTLPAPKRWFERHTLRGEIRAGEVRCVTGPQFRGSRLALIAPDATIEVNGTTFAVICGPDSTCLCVFDGSATMVTADGHAEDVAPATRRTVFRRGARPLLEEIRPEERMKLGMLADQSRALLESPEP